jgi:glycosyltransferase involved in cell wall biosynthesis
MLRAYDRPGGIGIYSRNILKHLLSIDPENHYVLIYNNKAHLGLYGDVDNVDEVYLPQANPIIWDQLRVPPLLKKWKIDLVFNTKFTVPLISKVKKIMVLHGASWFVHPELYRKYDVLYVRYAMPVYCRKADFLISNSDLTTKDFIRIVGVPETKIKTVRLSAGDEFKPVDELKTLKKVRDKYNLPDRFILTVTSYDPRKNFGTLLKAFETCLRKVKLSLVVVGKDCVKYADDFDLRGRKLKQFVYFPGWVEQKDLPSFYTLADAFVFPSIYEEFGIPVVEAMSCGCPVISSDTGAIPELTEGAALLSHPFDHRKLSENILHILLSNSQAEHYKNLGLKKADDFSWSKAAQQTLEVFRRVVSKETCV